MVAEFSKKYSMGGAAILIFQLFAVETIVSNLQFIKYPQSIRLSSSQTIGNDIPVGKVDSRSDIIVLACTYLP